MRPGAHSAEGEPLRVGLCHCFDCRRFHGAPFSAFVIFPSDRVTVSGPGVMTYPSSAHGRRSFCRICGSPVFARYGDGRETELFMGSFEEAGAFSPTYEAWIARREPWLPELPAVERVFERDRTHG